MGNELNAMFKPSESRFYFPSMRNTDNLTEDFLYGRREFSAHAEIWFDNQLKRIFNFRNNRKKVTTNA